MNESNESENKSAYLVKTSFHENPTLELGNFMSISNSNLEAFEEKIKHLCNTRKNDIWKSLSNVTEEYMIISKDIEKLSLDKIKTEGEVEYYKRNIHVKAEDISEMEQLIKECVITRKKLEADRSEVTHKLIEKHKALKQAIKYYKKRLNIYLSLEKKEEKYVLVICLFTQKFDAKYSFTVATNVNEINWELISTKPKLDNSLFLRIKERLSDENSISVLLCLIRKVMKEETKKFT